ERGGCERDAATGQRAQTRRHGHLALLERRALQERGDQTRRWHAGEDRSLPIAQRSRAAVPGAAASNRPYGIAQRRPSGPTLHFCIINSFGPGALIEAFGPGPG